MGSLVDCSRHTGFSRFSLNATTSRIIISHNKKLAVEPAVSLLLPYCSFFAIHFTPQSAQINSYFFIDMDTSPPPTNIIRNADLETNILLIISMPRLSPMHARRQFAYGVTKAASFPIFGLMPPRLFAVINFCFTALTCIFVGL